MNTVKVFLLSVLVGAVLLFLSGVALVLNLFPAGVTFILVAALAAIFIFSVYRRGQSKK